MCRSSWVRLCDDVKVCAAVNFGTWESLVAGVANADGLRRLRKEVRSAGTRPPPPKTPGPKLTVSNKAVYKPMLGAYALPFPGERQTQLRPLTPTLTH